MTWMWDAMWARIGWELGSMAVALAIFVAGVVIYAMLHIPRWRRQLRCEHPRVLETRACDAICAVCAKNLGFIGAWREKQAAAQLNVEDHEPPEPIQAYSKFPEPKPRPLKTVEVRDGPEVPF